MTKTQHAATETNNKMQQAIHTTSTVQAYPEVQQAQNSCKMQAGQIIQNALGQMGNTATLLQHQEMQKRQQDLQRQQQEVQKQQQEALKQQEIQREQELYAQVCLWYHRRPKDLLFYKQNVFYKKKCKKLKSHN